MKRILIVLWLLAASLVFSDSVRAERDSPLDQEIMEAIAGNDSQKALMLLNTAIERNPENIFALGARSQVFLQLGEVDNALDDMNTILDKDPTADGMLLYRCVVRESQAKNTSDALECYASAAQALERVYSRNELARKQEYIMLLLLAGSPNAENARKEHMAYLQTQKNSEFALSLIRNFDRSKIKGFIDAILAAQSNAGKTDTAR